VILHGKTAYLPKFGTRRSLPVYYSGFFSPLALAQVHAGAAAVLVDELDARLFKDTSDFLCCTGATRDRSIE
jgi:hypothetical protein